jgi:PAS domain S-box-containing protein
MRSSLPICEEISPARPDLISDDGDRSGSCHSFTIERQIAEGGGKHRTFVALAEYEEACRLLIEHIPAVTYIAAWDEHSSTLYASPQIERMLGFSQAEWTDDPMLWRKQLHPDDRAYVLAERARQRASGAPICCEYRMLARAGRVVWLRDDATIHHDESGRPLYLYGIMLDITERKRLEAELAQTQSLLAESMKSRLNEREIMVLRLIRAGCTDREIGQQLAIAERTVRYCLKATYAKLGVTKRIEAVREATRLKLIDDEDTRIYHNPANKSAGSGNDVYRVLPRQYDERSAMI